MISNANMILRDWESWITKRPAILLTDCKSVFDALNQQWVSGSKCDKRTSIDLSIIRDVLSRDLSKVRWIDTRMQLADSMNKKGVPLSLLRFVLENSKYIIVEETEALKLKKAGVKAGGQRNHGDLAITNLPGYVNHNKANPPGSFF